MKNLFPLLIFLVISIFAAAQSAPAQTLVHNYNFYDNSPNDTVGDANGALVGSATISNDALNTGGGSQQGLELNGPSVTDSAVSAITGSFTLEDFVTASSDSSNYPLLFGFGTTTSNYILSHNHTGGQGGPLTIEFDENGTPDVFQLTSGSLPTGSGQMVAVTYNAANNSVSTYLDGTLENTAVLPYSFDLSTIAGSASGGAGGFDAYNDPSFSGTTEDFAIYTGALTTVQIDADYADGGPVGAPEPCTWALMCGGLGLLFGLQQFRRRQA